MKENTIPLRETSAIDSAHSERPSEAYWTSRSSFNLFNVCMQLKTKTTPTTSLPTQQPPKCVDTRRQTLVSSLLSLVSRHSTERDIYICTSVLSVLSINNTTPPTTHHELSTPVSQCSLYSNNEWIPNFPFGFLSLLKTVFAEEKNPPQKQHTQKVAIAKRYWHFFQKERASRTYVDVNMRVKWRNRIVS